LSDSISRLAGRVQANYLNNGHLLYLDGDFRAIAAVANLVAALATQAQASAADASASLALMQALGASAYSIGTASLSLPRASDLGSAAYQDAQYASGIVVNLQNAAYQVTVHDYGKLLLTTSGTNTFTLPAATDLPDAWWCSFMNISGANLTFARTGSDTINAAATSFVQDSTAYIGEVARRSSSTFLIG